MNRMNSFAGFVCAGALLMTTATDCLAATSPRPIGDSKVIAAVPFPGYPEGIVVSKGRIYVSGPAAFGVPGNFVPSIIHVYDLATGASRLTS